MAVARPIPPSAPVTRPAFPLRSAIISLSSVTLRLPLGCPRRRLWFFVHSPIERVFAWAIQYLLPIHVAEVVPSPIHNAPYLGARRGKQRGVYAEPGGESDWTG